MEPQLVCRTFSVTCRAVCRQRVFATTRAFSKPSVRSPALASVKAGKGAPSKMIPASVNFEWTLPKNGKTPSPIPKQSPLSSRTSSMLSSVLDIPPPPPPVRDSPPTIKSSATVLWEDINTPHVAPARPGDNPVGSKERAQVAGAEALADMIDLKTDVFLAKAYGKGIGDDLRPTPRKRVSSGRIVRIRPYRDVLQCFKLLGNNVRRNDIKALEIRQRFHERPGLKRKRLRSERWKETFREGFQHAIKRVQTLKKMGW